MLMYTKIGDLSREDQKAKQVVCERMWLMVGQFVGADVAAAVLSFYLRVALAAVVSMSRNGANDSPSFHYVKCFE